MPFGKFDVTLYDVNTGPRGRTTSTVRQTIGRLERDLETDEWFFLLYGDVDFEGLPRDEKGNILLKFVPTVRLRYSEFFK